MEDEQHIRSVSERTAIRLSPIDDQDHLQYTNFETIANSRKIWKALALSAVCIAVTLTVAVMIGTINLEVSLTVEQPNVPQEPKEIIQQQTPIKKPKKHRGVHQFNLWDYSIDERKQLLAMRREEKSRNSSNDKYADIVDDKDEAMSAFFLEFEKNITVVNWSEFPMDENRWIELNQTYTQKLAERRRKFKVLEKEMNSFKDMNDFSQWDDHARGIKRRQIYDFMMYATMTGEMIDNSPHLKALYQKEKAYVNERYNTSIYKEELTACIIVPSYENEVNDRYMWNLESLFQQEYSNYRVIIMVDLSVDNTVNLIAEHLRWRNVPKEKYILVSSKTRNTALPNLYYSSNKFCKHGEYLGFVDGDDQLIGTQVFKVFSAMYQSTKAYVAYSSNLKYNPGWGRGGQVNAGVSQDYPDFTKRFAQFREYSRCLNHFRTIFTDIFFMISKESLSSDSGEIFWSSYDTAIFFPALDLSRDKVQYLSDPLYWYNAETGSAKNPFDKQKGPAQQLIYKKKHYLSIDRQLEKYVDRLNETEGTP